MGKADVILSVVIVVVLLSGLFSGSAIYSLTENANSGGSPVASIQPYDLTLVVTDGNWFNGTVVSQPSFFVLQGNTLSSSATITLPADRQIVLTVINNDNGTAQLSQVSYNRVMGTGNETVYVTNLRGFNMNELNNPESILSNGQGVNIAALAADDISHTFTIISGNTLVNIPIEPSSVEVATFTLPAGSYIWQCQCACGAGVGSWNGAMSASGWMNGVVTAS